MLKIGLTGGIGSGKSLIAEMFQVFGIPVYNADLRAKYLMDHDPEIVGKITELLGDEAYDSNQNLNRSFISSRIFADSELRGKLNKIVHPAVANDFRSWTDNMPHQTAYVIKEAAIMFESGSNSGMDKIICVSAPAEIRIKRVIARDGKSEELISEIIKSQLPEQKVIELSDFVINNDGLELLIPQVLSLHRTFRSLALG